MGWCQIGEKTSHSKVGGCVLGQGKQRAKSQRPWLFEQSGWWPLISTRSSFVVGNGRGVKF